MTHWVKSKKAAARLFHVICRTSACSCGAISSRSSYHVMFPQGGREEPRFAGLLK